MGTQVLGMGNARTIDEVIDRMTAINAALPSDDGVATFNRMYTQVTRLVRDAVDLGDFQAGEFLERLDVHFANLFFAACSADASGKQVPRAWAPLFEARTRAGTHPIQFALAGMNAHISHDLPFAVVTTCRELGVVPDEDTPEHLDYTRTNEVLELASVEIKSWFRTGVVATLDELGGRVDDGFAMFGIHLARAAAWQCSQMLWMLTDNPRMNIYYRESLGRGVEMTSRGILL
jgi:hypothetical protein